MRTRKRVKGRERGRAAPEHSLRHPSHQTVGSLPSSSVNGQPASDISHSPSPSLPPLSVCAFGGRGGALLAQSPSISLSVCCAYPVASRALFPCFTIGAELWLHGGFHGAHTTTLSLYWPLRSLFYSWHIKYRCVLDQDDLNCDTGVPSLSSNQSSSPDERDSCLC